MWRLGPLQIDDASSRFKRGLRNPRKPWGWYKPLHDPELLVGGGPGADSELTIDSSSSSRIRMRYAAMNAQRESREEWFGFSFPFSGY